MREFRYPSESKAHPEERISRMELFDFAIGFWAISSTGFWEMKSWYLHYCGALERGAVSEEQVLEGEESLVASCTFETFF